MMCYIKTTVSISDSIVELHCQCFGMKKNLITSLTNPHGDFLCILPYLYTHIHRTQSKVLHMLEGMCGLFFKILQDSTKSQLEGLAHGQFQNKIWSIWKSLLKLCFKWANWLFSPFPVEETQVHVKPKIWKFKCFLKVRFILNLQ